MLKNLISNKFLILYVNFFDILFNLKNHIKLIILIILTY